MPPTMTSRLRKKFPVRSQRNNTSQNHTSLLQELDAADLSPKGAILISFSISRDVISECTITGPDLRNEPFTTNSLI